MDEPEASFSQLDFYWQGPFCPLVFPLLNLAGSQSIDMSTLHLG